MLADPFEPPRLQIRRAHDDEGTDLSGETPLIEKMCLRLVRLGILLDITVKELRPHFLGPSGRVQMELDPPGDV